MKRMMAIAALMALVQSQSALADTCWKRASTEAAQVKQFDIMLMVSTLRCHGKGVDFSADYNRFVISKRPILRAVGGEMVQQLGTSMSAKAAMAAYDRIGVVMANKYGNGVEGLGCDGIRGVLALANDTPATRSGLVALAQQTGIVPHLPQPSCEPVVAARFASSDGQAPSVQTTVAQFNILPGSAAPPPVPTGMPMPVQTADAADFGSKLPDPTEIPLQIWGR